MYLPFSTRSPSITSRPIYYLTNVISLPITYDNGATITALGYKLATYASDQRSTTLSLRYTDNSIEEIYTIHRFLIKITNVFPVVVILIPPGQLSYNLLSIHSLVQAGLHVAFFGHNVHLIDSTSKTVLP